MVPWSQESSSSGTPHVSTLSALQTNSEPHWNLEEQLHMQSLRIQESIPTWITHNISNLLLWKPVALLALNQGLFCRILDTASECPCTGETQSFSFLLRRLSVAIQAGNAVSVQRPAHVMIVTMISLFRLFSVHICQNGKKNAKWHTGGMVLSAHCLTSCANLVSHQHPPVCDA